MLKGEQFEVFERGKGRQACRTTLGLKNTLRKGAGWPFEGEKAVTEERNPGFHCYRTGGNAERQCG